MSELAVTSSLGSATVKGVLALLERAAAADGRIPLSDHLLLDLERGGRPGFQAAIATDGYDTPIGYAQLSPGNGTLTLEVVVDPAQRTDDALPGRLVGAVLGAAGDAQPVDWWVFGATAADEARAADLGFTPGRHLHQMRRPLPTGLPIDVATRPFRPGEDEAAWVEVNNRAFATHPEQGGWTVESLRQREAEPWFDPAGFLLHERDGRLAAFCWTKLHADAGGTNIGEIYVIGVDPDFQGLGLGRHLTIAGLDAIAARGVDVGMLYVDADNTAAVTLYEHLGFTVFRTDIAFRRPAR